MEIIISEHTEERAMERGATKDDIIETIKLGTDFEAKKNRLGKQKVFPVNSERNGTFYEEKLVKVLFVIENNCIFTVTVMVLFGKFTKNENI